MRSHCYFDASIGVLASVLLVSGTAGFQAPAAEPELRDVKAVDVAATVSAVTLYRGRAAVTRSAGVELQPGVYDLRFTNLPESIHPESLQARTASGLRVLSVDYLQEATADPASTPAVAQIDQRIQSLTQALRNVADQRELIKSQGDFLIALTLRTTSDAAAAGGTDRINLDAVKKQMDFITAERKRLQTERAALDLEQPKLEADLAAAQANRDAMIGRASISRTAVISVVAPAAFNGEVALTCLVGNATWEPVYNVRATTDLSSTQIEYDAVLAQRTGEDWQNVRLTLSTAEPTVAANPPELQAWYVDVWQPALERAAEAGRVAARAQDTHAEFERRAAMGDDEADKKALEDLAKDAEVSGGGPSVTFELARAITVKTNVERRQATRIATINTAPTFVHVAVPMLTEAVYVRGDLANPSPYHLLPGRVSIFLGQDYVGPTVMPSVPPAGEFKMHFGIDQAVRARRQLASKVTENTGLLSGGRRTTFQYRVAIDNVTGRNLTVELWDRIPVSRTEEIQVQLIDPSPALATDAYYLTEQQPQGFLKWWLNVPAGASERNAFAVSWTVRVDRAKDVQMTPLPE